MQLILTVYVNIAEDTRKCVCNLSIFLLSKLLVVFITSLFIYLMSEYLTGNLFVVTHQVLLIVLL